MNRKKLLSLCSSLAVFTGCFFCTYPPDILLAEAVTEGSEESLPTAEVTLTEQQTEAVEEKQPESQSERLTESRSEQQSELETLPQTEPETVKEQMTERGSELWTEKQTEPQEAESQRKETEDIPVIPLPEEEARLMEETENLEIETEEESEKEYIDEFSGGYETWESYYRSGVFWDPSWYIRSDFRFSQVDKVYAIAEGGRSSRIYVEPDSSADIVGTIGNFNIAYVLEEKDGWSYIESGIVRGFVQSERILTGEEAEQFIQLIGEKAFSLATPEMSIYENDAFTYTLTTTQEVLAPKQYALALSSGDIYEFADDGSRPVGSVSSGTCVFILEKADSGWLYVESGDVRGFMKRDMLMTGETAERVVDDQGEMSARTADQLIDPKNNRSLYYTLKSTKSAAADVSDHIAESAASYAGHLPYVYGGSSLTSGADCSGFTQSVFASFGISIPRTAQEQGASGQAVMDLSQARPGDIIYYASGPHVGIYLGEGKVAQCSGNESNTSNRPGAGVTISSVDYMPVTSIRRYVIEADQMPEYGTGIGRIDARQYTTEELELIWAIVAQEDNGSYEGALAVITSAMNRTESPAWGALGGDALSQLTANGQYCYSLDHYWQGRLGGNVPSYVKQAVYDCLNRGVRNHSYTSFRSRDTGSAMRIGGNWFFGS